MLLHFSCLSNCNCRYNKVAQIREGSDPAKYKFSPLYAIIQRPLFLPHCKLRTILLNTIVIAWQLFAVGPEANLAEPD